MVLSPQEKREGRDKTRIGERLRHAQTQGRVIKQILPTFRNKIEAGSCNVQAVALLFTEFGSNSRSRLHSTHSKQSSSSLSPFLLFCHPGCPFVIKIEDDDLREKKLPAAAPKLPQIWRWQ